MLRILINKEQKEFDGYSSLAVYLRKQDLPKDIHNAAVDDALKTLPSMPYSKEQIDYYQWLFTGIKR
jgi:hypothetical protein